MPIQGIIFDLGHTLMHLNSAWPEIFEQGLVDLAVYLESQQLGLDGQAFGQVLLDRRALGFARARDTRREVTADESMRWTFAQFGLNAPSAELIEGAIDAFFAYEDVCWQVDPDALTVLRELADLGLRLGMFSNTSHDPFIQRLVDRFGFREWLDPALSSAGSGIRKPDPEAFQPILQAWDLRPTTLVMVGDTLEADILGAQQAGMLAVWVQVRPDARQEGASTGGALALPSIVPEATIRRLRDLPQTLAPWL